jgi:membrane protein DedA with SNARE-associated domain
MTGAVEAAAQAAPGGYAALFVVMLLSWAGLPVAGQAALAAAGVLASQERHELDIVAVLIVATVGSALGGIAAYWLGRHGGRALLTGRGPLRARRERELKRGQRLVHRWGPLAVFVVPMWVPGVYQMDWRRFVLWDVVAAVVWTLVAGLGGYWIGPSIVHSLGRVGGAVLVAAVVVVLALAVARMARRQRDSD